MREWRTVGENRRCRWSASGAGRHRSRATLGRSGAWTSRIGNSALSLTMPSAISARGRRVSKRSRCASSLSAGWGGGEFDHAKAQRCFAALRRFATVSQPDHTEASSPRALHLCALARTKSQHQAMRGPPHSSASPSATSVAPKLSPLRRTSRKARS